jgi:hypothetical protein
MTTMKITSLGLTEAFNDALRRGVVVAIASALVAGASFHLSPWYLPSFGGSFVVVTGVSGFVATLALLMGYYHRVILLGVVGAIIAFALPLASVLISLRLLGIPLKESRFWIIIPAGIMGEVIFEIIKKLHFKGRDRSPVPQ